MIFDLDQRTASLSVGELSDFAVGPRPGSGLASGLWRAQLGTLWHQQLRGKATAEGASAEFEVTVDAWVVHRGWRIRLTGRIDQVLPAAGAGGATLLREIKTVSRPLPETEAALRADYPEYFSQIATYVALHRLTSPAARIAGELLFVEIGTGALQVVPIDRTDEDRFTSRLEVLVTFLDARHRARERVRHLRYQPAFPSLRPGQESTRHELEQALARHRFVAFEAPTGFGKTGLLLECALAELTSGRCERILYLTSKSTGQLQVVRTLRNMTARNPDRPAEGTALAIWQVRAKTEHCVNPVFHCTRESCLYLAEASARWSSSGLSRFYLLDDHPRDLDTLRQAGREAQICPYEITRAALAFNDVWVGDYNYVFAPRNRRLFFDQLGFDPERTLLILDEAHNLPSRAADSRSFVVTSDDAHALLAELDHHGAKASLLRAWTAWTYLLASLPVTDALDLALEDDVSEALRRVADDVILGGVDPAVLTPGLADRLWETLDLVEWLKDGTLRRLLWSPRPGELRFTCIDASAAIGATLQSFRSVLLASATLGPAHEFAESVGLPAAQPTSATELNPLADTPAGLTQVVAATPWRDGAYRVAYDLRVDTRFRARASHAGTTAATVARLQQAAGACVAVFFPSYRYAEMIAEQIRRSHVTLRVVMQPRLTDLGAQAAWVEESVVLADVLFLVLGSSFAESIDALGGRISHAMVVGPALPEVNAVQAARQELFGGNKNPSAFRRVYQIPGMQKVNQALGRLVRAPGHRATVLLHCARFAEISYAALLAPDYQFGTHLTTDAELEAWLTAAV
jgi:DNA excision repair protein ERCC-2